MKTVAEYVDQAAVLERLEVMGIDYGQGYLLNRPEPIDRLLGQPVLKSQASGLVRRQAGPEAAPVSPEYDSFPHF
jgi:EAL domain-containing protein (putative c-di-GMP-specific phosphodiesterase class I)